MDKAQQAVARLREGGWTLATAESLTGGMLGETITSVSGSSVPIVVSTVALMSPSLPAGSTLAP